MGNRDLSQAARGVGSEDAKSLPFASQLACPADVIVAKGSAAGLFRDRGMRSEDANSLPVDRELTPPYGSHRGVRVGGRTISAT